MSYEMVLPGKDTKAEGKDTPGDQRDAALEQSAELQQGTIYRQAAGEALDAVAAGAVLEQAKASSTGQAMSAPVRADMESSLGGDFKDVRVHTGSAAVAASKELNAHAFTNNSDVFFGAGKYAPETGEGRERLAHELTHVMQGPENSATRVSSPGEAAEREAESAAAAVAAGGKAGAVTQQAAGIARDAMGDFKGAASSGWFHSVNPAKALEHVQKMTQAERKSLVTDEKNHAYMERVFKKADVKTALALTRAIPMDIRWKLYFLTRGTTLQHMNAEQWQKLIGLSNVKAMEELRKYPHGFKAFINNAPANLIRPGDLLKALFDGVWANPTADAITKAIRRLSPPQRKALRENKEHMETVCSKMGTKASVFSLLTSVDMPVKWSVYHLDKAGHIGVLSDEEWSQLLMEASAQERAELKGWPAVWKLTEKHCPKTVLDLVEKLGKEDGTVDDMFDSNLTVAMSFQAMGAEAFLAMATQKNADVPGNYAAVKSAGYVDRVIAAIPRGTAMGVDTQNNLRQWFMAGGETHVPTLEKMINRRFNINANASAAATTKHAAHATVTQWTAAGLRRAWTVMESLPPQQVAGNAHFVQLLRNGNANNGNAYAWKKDIMMGYRNDGQLNKNVKTSTSPIFAGKTINTFNATLRHEIGHAVDNNLGIMKKWQGEKLCGAWKKHATYTEWVDAIISAGGGINATTAATHGYPAADWPKYRQAMIRAVTQSTDFNTALKAIKPTAANAPDKGPIQAVYKTTRWTGGGSGPWYKDSDAKPQGGRIFQRAYSKASSLWSYDWATRQAHEVTKYQWRAPGEWFAEAYQVYYAEQEQGGDKPVGGLLRSKDQATAEFIAQIVDQGFSPQQMKDGTTQKAPDPNG